MTHDDHDRIELSAERLARITARVEAGMEPAGSTRAGLRLLRASIILLVVAAAIVAGLAMTTSRGGSPDGPASSPTAPGPAELARRAAELPAAAVGPHQWSHTVERMRQGSTATETEEWLALDGSSRQSTVSFDEDGRRGPPSVREDVPVIAGARLLGLSFAAVVELEGSVDDVAAAFGIDGRDPEAIFFAARNLVRVLAQPGVPAPVRSHVFSLFERAGFTAEPAGPGLVELRGTSAAGDTFTATFDVATTRPVRSEERSFLPDPATEVEFVDASVTATAD